MAAKRARGNRPRAARQSLGGLGGADGGHGTAARSWWGQLETREDTPGFSIHERWLMVRCWLSRSAPVLEKALAGLAGGPLLLRAKFEGHIGEQEGQSEIKLLNYSDAKAAIDLEVYAEARTVLLVFRPRSDGRPGVAPGDAVPNPVFVLWVAAGSDPVRVADAIQNCVHGGRGAGGTPREVRRVCRPAQGREPDREPVW